MRDKQAKGSKPRGHIRDTTKCFLLLLECHSVRSRSCDLLELRLAIPLSRRYRGFKSRRGRQQNKDLCANSVFPRRPRVIFGDVFLFPGRPPV